jgi:Holliday junction resolvasome RuvABC endonuclease subunit
MNNHTFIGIDPGLRRVSVAAVQGVQFKVRTLTLPPKTPTFTALVELDGIVETLIDNMEYYWDDRACPATSILVEQPSGRFVNLSLSYAAGVIIRSAEKYLPGRVATVPSPQWKKAIGLKGNAGKPETMAYAQRFGYEGDIEDEADAICIARACQKMTTIQEAPIANAA